MPDLDARIEPPYDSSVIDLGRLRVLVAVAREGSVTAAAQALHYAQPSVSHHLARLEAEVGVPLLQRMGRGIRLTEAGRLLVARAEPILAQLEAVGSELEDLAGLRSGRARLVAFPSALATIVPATAARIVAGHPGLELALTEAEPPEAVGALRAGDADLAVVFEYGDPNRAESRDTATTPLFTDPMFLVVPAREPAPPGPVDLSCYSGSRWIAGCERCREHLVGACREAGFTPDITFETEDYVAVQALVAAGLGVSLLPGLTLVANRHPGVRIHRIDGPGRRVLAAAVGRPLSGPAQMLLEALTASPVVPDWPV